MGTSIPSSTPGATRCQRVLGGASSTVGANLTVIGLDQRPPRAVLVTTDHPLLGSCRQPGTRKRQSTISHFRQASTSRQEESCSGRSGGRAEAAWMSDQPGSETGPCPAVSVSSHP